MALRNVTGARCTVCGRVSPAEPETTVCPHCGGILDIEYDYDYIRSCFQKHPLRERNDPTMWRYLELLPVEGLGTRPRLRVGGSPLYRADALGKELGIRELWIKDDGQNPTASLKDRASAMAVVKAQEAGKAVIADKRMFVRRGKRSDGTEDVQLALPSGKVVSLRPHGFYLGE